MCPVVEHFGGQILENGQGLLVQVLHHCDTFPSRQQFDNTWVTTTFKSHRPPCLKRTSGEIIWRNSRDGFQSSRMNMQGVSDHRHLHWYVYVLRAVITCKFHVTIKRKIETTKMSTVKQEMMSGGTDRASQNVVRTSVGYDDSPIVIFLGSER